MKSTGLTIIVILASFITHAQNLPAENDTTNYRMSGFSVPSHKKATKYLFEIAEGINNNDVFFKKNIIIKAFSDKNNTIQTLPAFNKPYTWRVTYLNKKGKEIGTTKLLHFYTGIIPYVDTSVYRLRITDSATHHKNLLIFCDRTRTLYNMKGEPLWFIPNIPGIIDNSTSVRDLKITPFGTLTFLINDRGYEIDYRGKIVWTPPNDGKISGDTTEHYHHEFTRLENGHYMIAGNEILFRKMPDVPDSSFVSRNGMIEKRGDNYFYKLILGTIIEYDSAKNIVWSWKSSGYLNDADLFSKKSPKGNVIASTHQNSFFFDEKRSCIYTSFRDINRIVKIEYPSGRILAQYGENYQNDSTIIGNGLFYGQHCCRVNDDGKLYLFNNNFKGRGTLNEETVSTVKVINEPKQSHDSASIFWEFACDFDTSAHKMATAGGSVLELGDGCFFVCMGSVNKNFIVNRKKEIVWNAYAEMKSDTGWQPVDSYRSSPILNDDQLNNLIFNAIKGKLNITNTE